MKFKPRDYQIDAHSAILREWETVTSTLVVAPTGTGKTCLFAMVCESVQPKRAMIIAHREELIIQARDKVKMVTGLECGIEMADQYVNNSLFGEMPIVVSTIQTQNSNFGDRKRMSRFNPKDFGVLICDEAHHCTAPSYRHLINYYMTANPEIKVLGVTATADRADEAALGQVFESVAFDYEILDAIHDGYLVPIEQQFVSISGLDFSEMRTTAGDLNGADLAAVMESENNMQGVASSAIQIIGSKRAIVFTASVKQAETVSSIFNRHREGMANWVCGMTNKDDRRELLSNFKTGKVQVVCNCGVLTEGFDDPGVEVIIMARPTKSRSLYAQMAGRSTRPLAGLVDHLEDKDARKTAIASSAKPSCIAEGGLVLTDRGLIPIQNITSKMKIWDGIEFVTNSGIVYQGKQEIIEYAGLRATKDHKVWTKEGWSTFGECSDKQIAISVTGIGGQAVREVDGYFRGYNQEDWSKKISTADDPMPMRKRIPKGVFKSRIGSCGLSGLCSSEQSEQMSSMVAASLPISEAEMHRSELYLLPSLWWKGDKVQLQKCRGDGGLDSGEHWTETRTDNRSSGQQRPLRTGKPSLGNHAIPSSQLKNVKVYDIINCGPRNRFTVNGLLVSNCLIVDFVGNSGKHKLMSAAEILGGKVSDEAIAVAIRKAKESGSAVRISERLDEEEDAIQAAAEQRRLADEARKAKLVAKAKYSIRTINPFDIFQIAPAKERGWDEGKVLTEKQTALLLKQGINPDGMPYAQAKQVLNELFRRWKAKLATVKQVTLLQRYGYKDPNITFEQASNIINKLAASGWRKN